MKELTIEEKAKRYDELIVTAQELEHDGCFDKITLFDLFPELEESEDERIKKAIKYGLDYVFTNNTTVCETTKEQCLAWLEKQGEKKPEVKIPSEYKVELIDIHYQRMKHALGMDNKEAKDGVYYAYRNSSTYNTFDDIWEQLVCGGYANRIYKNGVDICYSVTRKGIQAVSNETGLMIRYEIECRPQKK